MAAKKKCRVVFIKSRDGSPAAVRFDARGRSVNYIQYPRGARLTAREKLRARQALCGVRAGALARLGVKGRRMSVGKR